MISFSERRITKVVWHGKKCSVYVDERRAVFKEKKIDRA